MLSVQKCLKRGSEREGGSIVDEGRGCRRERERGTVGECNRAEINQLAAEAAGNCCISYYSTSTYSSSVNRPLARQNNKSGFLSIKFKIVTTRAYIFYKNQIYIIKSFF